MLKRERIVEIPASLDDRGGSRQGLLINRAMVNHLAWASRKGSRHIYVAPDAAPNSMTR